jgi:hypothetical protein
MPVTRPEAVRRNEAKAARAGRPAPSLVGHDGKVPEAGWYTPEAANGWTVSVMAHATLLVVLALWYTAPRPPQARPFDTRLAGSENGVDYGLELAGGLNTPIELTTATTPSPGPSASPLQTLELETLMPPVENLNVAEKPSGGGGIENLNPGAGNGDGFGLARFGEGGENINGVAVKVGDPQFTLIWDSEVDLDLHVIEPGGKEIYWESPKGKFGGELDVDNTKGFGPENVYWLREDQATGKRVKGQGPPGMYRWFVVYWGGFGGVPKSTHWKVRVKHAGKVTVVTGKFKALNERSREYTLQVAPTTAGGTPVGAIETTD